MNGPSALFLLMDVVPDYVEKTFGFKSDNHLAEYGFYKMLIVREGEDIPKNLDFALILLNESVYHLRLAEGLQRQILDINPQATVVGVMVQG